MNRFAFSHLVLLLSSGMGGGIEQLTEWSEENGCHVVKVSTGPFSGINICLTEGAANLLGLKSQTDVLDLNSETEEQLKEWFSSLYLGTKHSIQDGTESFQVWGMTAEEHTAQMQPVATQTETV